MRASCCRFRPLNCIHVRRMIVPTDDKMLEPDTKRAKTEGGWQTVPEDAPELGLGVGAAATAGAASAQMDEDHDWEDAAGATAGDGAEPGGDDDGFDWEEA